MFISSGIWSNSYPIFVKDKLWPGWTKTEKKNDLLPRNCLKVFSGLLFPLLNKHRPLFWQPYKKHIFNFDPQISMMFVT